MLNKFTVIGTLKVIDPITTMDKYSTKITVEVDDDTLIILIPKGLPISETLAEETKIGIIGTIKSFDTAMVPIADRIEIIEGSED